MRKLRHRVVKGSTQDTSVGVLVLGLSCQGESRLLVDPGDWTRRG